MVPSNRIQISPTPWAKVQEIAHQKRTLVHNKQEDRYLLNRDSNWAPRGITCYASFGGDRRYLGCILVNELMFEASDKRLEDSEAEENMATEELHNGWRIVSVVWFNV